MFLRTINEIIKDLSFLRRLDQQNEGKKSTERANLKNNVHVIYKLI